MNEAALAGLALPLVLSMVNQRGWSGQTKSFIMFAACLVVTAADRLLTGTSTGDELVVVLTATVSSYYGFWKPTGIAGRVEDATMFSDDD